MGRYIEQTESRSELQQRIAADLRAKAAAKAKQEGGEAAPSNSPDGVEDSAYIKGTKATTTLAPVWLLIFLAIIGAFIYFIFLASK
jgi:hypothetical protein